MARRRHHHQSRLAPTRRQCIGSRWGADHVVSPLDDHTRNARQKIEVVEDRLVRGQEDAVVEVVVLEARKGAGVIRRPAPAAFPYAPLKPLSH